MLSSSSPDSRSFHTMKSASYNPSLSSSLYSYYLQPSQRFADPSRASSSNQSSGKLSTSGRILVATNAGAICSSIAALTSLRTPGSIHFKASFEDFFRGHRSAYHAADHQSRMGDLAYLKNLGQCFSFELCRYSRISPTCQSVVRSGLEHIINHFLEALVDPEILHRLPSSNKAIISRLGGPKAQEMEVKYLKRMLRRSPSGDQEDDEAIGARLIDNEMFDSPGPAFMASRLWSFGRLLGNLIEEISPTDQEVARIGKVLSKPGGDLEGDAADSSRNSLALVPLISMERECMKRVVMLRSIVSVLSEDHIIGRAATNAISLLTKNVLQNIYYLSAAVEYNERRTGGWEANPNADPEDLYERARALALQHAYGEVASSFFAWLLYQGAHSNNLHRLNPTVIVLKDVLLRTSLLKSSTNFCSALEAHNSKSIPPYVFDVLASKGGSSSGNGWLAEDLFDGLGRRYHELIAYAADSFDLSSTTDMLSMLIESRPLWLRLATTQAELNCSALHSGATVTVLHRTSCANKMIYSGQPTHTLLLFILSSPLPIGPLHYSESFDVRLYATSSSPSYALTPLR